MFQPNLASHVYLNQKQQGNKFVSHNQNSNSPFITLIDQNFEFLPRLFMLTTNNGSYKFNVDILRDASKTISKHLEVDPNNFEYHLDINDEKNTMKKFEDIFRGYSSIFEFDELVPARQIIKLLMIDNCPIYFKANLSSNYYSIPSKIEIEIEKSSLLSFLSSNSQKNFTIKTNKNEYKCIEMGSLSSKVIRDEKTAKPQMNEYKFNFDDEDDEFKLICNLFNFEKIYITINNMDSLKTISDELKIEPIIDSINKFISSYENSVQLIDDKKMIIETIDEIFYLLHNIQSLTVETVKNSIINSIWAKTEENVIELAACIFQAVRIGYKLQPYLIDLVISLNDSADDKNELNILIPYLVNQLKFDFSKTPFYSSFYFRLAQKGVVDMEEALSNATKIVMSGAQDKKPRKYKNSDIVNVLKWFLPELFEKNKTNKDFYNIRVDIKNAAFFVKFFPSNADEYKKMRDSGMPIDDISRSIYNDDVDTLQSIVTKSGIDINVAKIPRSIFDVFEFDSPISFINYSVMHGSVKCFKYLLLNHAEMDSLTFVLSIYGGNTEIIRSVDQTNPRTINLNANLNVNSNEQFFSFSEIRSNGYYNYDSKYFYNIVAPAIMNHQNDLFDWIFENKYDVVKSLSLLDIAFIAVQNGNAHALIQCIDKGLDFNSNSNNNNFILAFVNEACYNGFYRILQLVISLFKDDIQLTYLMPEQLFHSGNALIYNLLKSRIRLFTQKNNFNSVMLLRDSIKRSHNKLIMQIIESGNIMLNKSNSFKVLFSIVIKSKNVILFNFLRDKYTFEKISNLYSSTVNDTFNIFFILNKSCRAGFFSAVKDITEFILSKNPNADFTSSFYCAVCEKQKEIYEYLLSKNVMILIKQNDPNLYAITLIDDDDLCVKLLNKIKPEMKEDVLNKIFKFAVVNGNKNLVELLLNKDRLNKFSLIDAVHSKNIDIVNMILSLKSDSNFINFVHEKGTALNVAVKNNSIEIVKRLLSIPGINTTYYDCNECTPLMTAITNFNIEMINLFVSFYGDQMKYQTWQLNNSILKILSSLSKIDDCPIDLKSNRRNDDDDDETEDDDDEERDMLKMRIISINSTYTNKEKIYKTISELAKFDDIDLNCHFSSYTLLSYACEVNEFDLFTFLLKSKKVDVNKYSPLTGNTPLMAAVDNDNVQIAQLLIDHDQTDINHRNYKGQTALVFAAMNENEQLVHSLVNSEKFDPDLSALFDAYFISKKNIAKILLNVKGFDVNTSMEIQNYINLFEFDLFSYTNFKYCLEIPFVTPLIKAVLELNSEMIDLIVAHPMFNKEKSRYVDAIFASVYMDDVTIFRKLLTLFGNDVNLIGNNGVSLLYFSIYMRTSDITTEILNNDNFDSEKSGIVSAFLKAGLFITSPTKGSDMKSEKSILTPPVFGTPRLWLPNDIFLDQRQHPPNAAGVGFGGQGVVPFTQNLALIDQMNELFNFDENHQKLIKFNEFLPSGKTFFTSINSSSQNVGDVVNFLVAHGADPNLPDKNGVYPIEYCIQLGNSNFIQAMLHLNMIDLTIKSFGNCINSVKGDTILHSLIQSSLISIFNDVLRIIDLDIINHENDNGDTPLLIACKFTSLNFIMALFSKDNLDYKHRNKEGKDALDIIKSINNQLMKGQFRNSNNFKWMGGFNNNNVQLDPKDIQNEEKREYYEKIIEFF